MVSEPRTASATPGSADEVEERLRYFRRWLRVWVALLVVATLTIVAYLIIIGLALDDVDDNVAIAERRVAAVRENVSILPGQINTINSHLASIDTNLENIPQRVERVNESLASVDNSLVPAKRTLVDIDNILVNTEASLNTTDELLATIDGSLVDTDGALKDTESVLNSVQGLADEIEITLEDAESPPNDLDSLADCPPDSVPGSLCEGQVSAGAEGIYERVAVANSILAPAQRDTSNILNSLTEVNNHLKSICEGTVPQVLGTIPPPPPEC
jgi:archaellum component FlaC